MIGLHNIIGYKTEGWWWWCWWWVVSVLMPFLMWIHCHVRLLRSRLPVISLPREKQWGIIQRSFHKSSSNGFHLNIIEILTACQDLHVFSWLTLWKKTWKNFYLELWSVKTNVCFVSVTSATRIQATRLPSGPVGKLEEFSILVLLGLSRITTSWHWLTKETYWIFSL